MDYQVYIVQNPAGKKYIGLSSNIENRLDQHNSGGSKYTKTRGPWSFIWASEKMDLSEARKLENKLKRQKGGRGLQTLMDVYGS